MNLFSCIPAAALVAAVLTTVHSVEAHFIWLVPQVENGQTTVQVYFGEGAFPDDPEYLSRLKDMQLWRVTGDETPVPLDVTLTAESLSAKPVSSTEQSLFLASHDWGVFSPGDAVFRLKYYAKTGPEVTSDAWMSTNCADDLRFDLVPTLEGGQLTVKARFDGQPIEGAQIVAFGPGLDHFEGHTTSEGEASFAVADPGLYSVRARHIENTPGELDGDKYQDVRHYTTLAVTIPGATQTSSPSVSADVQIPPLPEAVTSFGGAICGDYLYVYGGHRGSAHSYSKAEQGHQLRRVPLQGGEWEVVAEGPHLQGLALVAHNGKLYRIGGFTAKNAEGEEHDLWSQDDVACFDPDTGEWTGLPPLPEPRSSHDAAVVGDTIFVVGGWTLAGDADNEWHETAWAMDLSEEPLQWKPLPTAPFHRRALATAAHGGKLYVIGGMQQEEGPTRKVAVFDPITQRWTEGPPLVEPEDDSTSDAERSSPSGMTGFGASAFATGGHLYVSTIKGNLQRLNADGTAWEIVAETPTARFFHRLLPVDEHRLLVVGGANMGIGKFERIDIIEAP